MKKVKLIDKNQYFVESKKAIQIAIEKEKNLYNELPKQDKLSLLKKRKQETNSIEEYEKIEELEKQLEKEIKFNAPIPLFPDEYKETIKRNVAIEAAEVNKKLKESRVELKNQIPYLQNVLLPLLVNIHELKKMNVVPHNIDIIMDFDFHEGSNLRAETFIFKTNEKDKGELVNVLNKIIDAIEAVTIKEGENK